MENSCLVEAYGGALLAATEASASNYEFLGEWVNF
jgi:hypothetical protein